MSVEKCFVSEWEVYERVSLGVDQAGEAPQEIDPVVGDQQGVDSSGEMLLNIDPVVGDQQGGESFMGE